MCDEKGKKRVIYASTSCTRWLFRFFSSTSVGVSGFWSISRPEGPGEIDRSVVLLTSVGFSSSADRGLALETETDLATPTVVPCAAS
jgi:hypothetical protein